MKEGTLSIKISSPLRNSTFNIRFLLREGNCLLLLGKTGKRGEEIYSIGAKSVALWGIIYTPLTGNRCINLVSCVSLRQVSCLTGDADSAISI
jgi:hypothetical protein